MGRFGSQQSDFLEFVDDVIVPMTMTLRSDMLLGLLLVSALLAPGGTFVLSGRHPSQNVLYRSSRSMPGATVVSAKKGSMKRVDDLMVDRAIVADRKAAQALILAGDVFVKQDHKVASGAFKVTDDTPLRVRTRKSHPWVSRGGLKLEHAIKTWELESIVDQAVAIDVGSSTGGFTDVLLSHGARQVFAVDVGYGVLDYRLRNDERVVVWERTNAKHINGTLFESRPGEGAAYPSLVVCDVSFISLKSALKAVVQLPASTQTRTLVTLIKPQFEAKASEVQAGGVVTDPSVHERVCDEARQWIEDLAGWSCHGIVESPITGPNGNKEFLLYASCPRSSSAPSAVCDGFPQDHQDRGLQRQTNEEEGT